MADLDPRLVGVMETWLALARECCSGGPKICLTDMVEKTGDVANLILAQDGLPPLEFDVAGLARAVSRRLALRVPDELRLASNDNLSKVERDKLFLYPDYNKDWYIATYFERAATVVAHFAATHALADPGEAIRMPHRLMKSINMRQYTLFHYQGAG